MTPADPPTCSVLLLPGWQNSAPAHWQSRWESLYGYRRVEQDSWLWPRRGDWMARLEDVLLRQPGVVLVAHSLGCQLVASWAAHSRHAAKVHAALLVAPPDIDRADMPPKLFSWRPLAHSRLPFNSLVVSSGDDPYCDADRAAEMAATWGSHVLNLGVRGHINEHSGLGDWAQGHTLLQGLISRFS